MNILWLTNIALPEACKLMNENPVPFGGWLVGASSALAKEDGIKLSVAFPKRSVREVQVLKGERINYYAFPAIDEINYKLKKSNGYLKQIINEVNPDIVHIFGTEFAHTLTMVNICNGQNIKAVISVQGLTSIIARHYLVGIPPKVQRRFTLKDLMKQDNLIQLQAKFAKRGELEIEALRKVKHIIGRTTWDKACTSQINPDATYHFCNETLRDEFYKHNWNINSCERYSIFVSQGQYPIKGLHFMLEAMPIILKRFPEAKLYVGGHNITSEITLKEKLKISSYGKYIKELIRKHDLESKVFFTGVLDEKQMCNRFLNSHIFVSPSIVENESNSLSEAKILGVPVVASYVGGVIDRIKHNHDGYLYQADAPYMLAYYVCKIFRNEELALKFSKNAREHALETHDRDRNTRRLIEIYENIIQIDNKGSEYIY